MIRSLAIPVRDPKAAAEFWAESFGVEFREVVSRGRSGMFGDLHGVTLKLLAAEEDEVTGGGHRIGLGVRDVAEAIGRACGSGGRLVGEPLENGGRMHAVVADPDGNEIELYTL